ncbi:MAG TPA: biotin/lipoyl-containing protein, partial [Pyrinomonadaceae bacterium]|nr:biotin/lipoyl-containing protein [Pyrinomonadaceae bacterium]
MATQVVMPKLSPTMEEGQISRWLKKEGDKVSMGEPLAEIDTDKATMEMQALSNGVLRKIIIQAGESAPLGQMIAVIGEPDEDISALLSQAGSGAQGAQAAAPQQQAGGGEAKAEAAGGQKDSAADAAPQQQQQPASSGNGAQAARGGDGQATGRLVVSPLAARMAAEAGINLRTLTGSGPGGRIIKRDIEAAMSAGKPAAEEAAQAPQRHLRAVQPGAQAPQGPAPE